MLAAALALAGALVWGGADFLGGVAARRMHAVRVTLFAGLGSVVLLVPAQLLVPGTWSPHDLLWGALSGAFYVVGLLALYAALATGPMVILSPLAAVISAVVPAGWAFVAEGELLGPIAWAGAACAVAAVVLIARARGEHATRPKARPLALAAASGVGFGAFLIALDRTGDDAGLTPLVANRAVLVGVCAIVIGALALRRGRDDGSDGAPATGVRLAVATGLCDAVANALILTALRSGELSVVSVLQALYPAGTVLLAALVLRERLAPPQWAGLALALTAGALFALG